MYQTSAHITTLNNSARESEEFLPSTAETLERQTPFTVFRGVVGPYTGTLLPFWGLQRHSNKPRHCTHKNDLPFVIKTHWNVFDKNAGLSTPASPGHRGQFHAYQISLPGSKSRIQGTHATSRGPCMAPTVGFFHRDGTTGQATTAMTLSVKMQIKTTPSYFFFQSVPTLICFVPHSVQMSGHLERPVSYHL